MAKSPSQMTNDELVAWIDDFVTNVTALAVSVGVSSAQITVLEGRATGFTDSVAVTTNPVTRTSVAIQQRNAARASLLAYVNYLVDGIFANPETTNAQRQQLGIRLKTPRQHSVVPSEGPSIDLVSINGRTAIFQMHGEDGKRRKPRFVKGASVYVYYGPTAPEDITAWRMEGLVTKTRFEIVAPESTTGTTMWVCANWFTDKGQTSVACAPVSVNLPASAVVPVTAKMSIAA